MCGRYASARKREELLAEFRIERDRVDESLAPDNNVAPTKQVNAVMTRGSGGGGDAGPQDVARELRVVRWGLVPYWAKDVKSVRQPINARAETAATAPMFRDALERRRCLVPADVFYEWQATEQGKQPFAIARADGQPMAFAGLWEGWRGADGTVLRSFAIVTTNANPVLRLLHERMPVILEPVDWPAWLGEVAGDPGAMLRPSAAELRMWRIGKAVNSVRNDSASLLEPV